MVVAVAAVGVHGRRAGPVHCGLLHSVLTVRLLPQQFFLEGADTLLGHGLLVAFFGMTAMVASAALWKTDVKIWRLPPPSLTASCRPRPIPVASWSIRPDFRRE